MRTRFSGTKAPHLLLLLALLLPAGAAAEDGSGSLPPVYGGGLGYERSTYGGGGDKRDVTRYVAYGEAEIPRLSLLGDDRLSFRLGLHAFTLDGRDRTSPSLMFGADWTGILAPASVDGKGLLPGWRVEVRVGARFYDSPEGPSGNAIDLSGDVLFRRRTSTASGGKGYDVWLGPSLRYGILPIDHRTTLDNGSVARSTTNATTDSVFRMAGVVAGAEIPVGKKLLLRPEVRLGADYAAYVSLSWLPPPPPAPKAAEAPPPAPEQGGDAPSGGDGKPAGAEAAPAAKDSGGAPADANPPSEETTGGTK